jgi:hypothetical protein
VEQALACGGGGAAARNRNKIGWQNPAIQIACQSRKTDRFQTFWPRLYWFDAAVGVTDAGKPAGRSSEK